MIQSNTLTYYKWDSIEQYICTELNIPVQDFRDYHKYVPEGKSYKDWWHVWLTIVYDNVTNGGFYDVWFDILIDNLQSPHTLGEYGDWVLKLVPILRKLQSEIGEEFMVVQYSW